MAARRPEAQATSTGRSRSSSPGTPRVNRSGRKRSTAPAAGPRSPLAGHPHVQQLRARLGEPLDEAGEIEQLVRSGGGLAQVADDAVDGVDADLGELGDGLGHVLAGLGDQGDRLLVRQQPAGPAAEVVASSMPTEPGSMPRACAWRGRRSTTWEPSGTAASSSGTPRRHGRDAERVGRSHVPVEGGDGRGGHQRVGELLGVVDGQQRVGLELGAMVEVGGRRRWPCRTSPRRGSGRARLRGAARPGGAARRTAGGPGSGRARGRAGRGGRPRRRAGCRRRRAPTGSPSMSTR